MESGRAYQLLAEWTENIWDLSDDNSNYSEHPAQTLMTFMNIYRIPLVVWALVVSSPGTGVADKSIPRGASFVSPNGRYCVQLYLNESFVIKDTVTGRVDTSITSTGVLYFRWAANSGSFVTVEHIANGSYGRVVYLDQDKWNSVEVYPPHHGKMNAAVINLELSSDRVHYKFAVEILGPHWEAVSYRICDLDVILQTGRTSDIRWTPLSKMAWAAALTSREPSYMPPMEKPSTTPCLDGIE